MSWIWENVPTKFYFWFFGILFSAVGFGFGIGQISIVQNFIVNLKSDIVTPQPKLKIEVIWDSKWLVAGRPEQIP